MKKIIILTISVLLIYTTGIAQKRNLLPNANFEKVDFQKPEGWTLGNQVHITNTSNGDTPVQGEYSIHVNGAEVDESSVLFSNHIWASGEREIYKVTFKANAIGGDARIKARILQHQGTMHDLFIRNLLGEENEIIISGEETKEYKITGISFDSHPEMVHRICDYTQFSLDFSSMRGTNVVLTLDDIRIVRIDHNGEAVGNINTEPERIRKNGLSETIWFWKEHQSKEWQLKMKVESDTETEAVLKVEGDWAEKMNDIPLRLNHGVHTYCINLGSALLANQETSGMQVKVSLEVPSEKIIVSEFYLTEKADLTALVIDIPEQVKVGETVPVSVFSEPTNADNSVNIICTAGAKIEKNENGWLYTQLSEDEVKVHATSLINKDIQEEVVVNVRSVTSLTNGNKDTIKVVTDNRQQQISIYGLSGNEKIELINATGEIIRVFYSEPFISTSSFASGVYILNITGNGKEVIEKVIIK